MICKFCGTVGRETCNDCYIEQSQVIEEEEEFEETREFVEKTFAQQDELAYLDKMLFGGR